ncbi:HutD family protein [Glutamicibacter mishrai]|uniref:HutD/Ves family protein n=1 Tax=Glutamicibacter mishrai TaxID=1775880 RepID=UPI0020CE941F|nr:HutD family protein [Glutamicibacter mishrai]UTT40632.1 HutD family protein [Glutamicibacter mishrai]
MPADPIVRYADLPAQPWKNGKGISRTLFSDANSQGAWSWKVSIAEISQPQPYSQYPGIRRVQVALGPGEIDLEVGGERHRLRAGGQLAFSGDDEVSVAPLGIEFLALNLMFAGEHWEAKVSTTHDSEQECCSGQVKILVALNDHCQVGNDQLNRLDALMVSSESRLSISGSFHLVTFSPSGEDSYSKI